MLFDLYDGRSEKSSVVSDFYGLNRTRRSSAGEFSDTYNMATEEYPCAAPRLPRAEAAVADGDILAVAAPDNVGDNITSFTGIAGGSFVYNGQVKSEDYEFSNDMKWEIVRIANLYVMNGYDRDSGESVMYWYNSDTDRFDKADSGKCMENLIVAAGNDSNGSYLATFRYGFDAVYDYKVTVENVTIKNSDFFDTYGKGSIIEPPNIFSRYFSGGQGADPVTGLTSGDEVSISGFPARSENVGQIWTYNGTGGEVVPQRLQDFSYNNTVDLESYSDTEDVDEYTITNAYIKSFDIKELAIEGRTVYVHYVYFDLYNKNGDRLKFEDMITDTQSMYCSGVRIERKRRTFSHICIHNNRIWGTYPGGNKIYASSSDDIFNFTSAEIDKLYAASLVCDTPGDFTGMAEIGSELAVFKEDSISVIYGSSPKNYSISNIYGSGCVDGMSIQRTPSGVIFLAYDGFMLFNGGTPIRLSDKLNTRYKSAVSGFDGNVYYASSLLENGEYELITYDTRYGIWLKQDNVSSAGFFRYRDGFYMACGNTVYRLDTDQGDEFEWSFTSKIVYDDAMNNKALNEIWIEAEISSGAYFMVSTSVDDDEFTAHSIYNADGLHIFRCPIRAVMGNRCRYKISGRGKVVFYEVELRSAEGGRVYKDDDVTAQLSRKKHSLICY